MQVYLNINFAIISPINNDPPNQADVNQIDIAKQIYLLEPSYNCN